MFPIVPWGHLEVQAQNLEVLFVRDPHTGLPRRTHAEQSVHLAHVLGRNDVTVVYHQEYEILSTQRTENMMFRRNEMCLGFS